MLVGGLVRDSWLGGGLGCISWFIHMTDIPTIIATVCRLKLTSSAVLLHPRFSAVFLIASSDNALDFSDWPWIIVRKEYLKKVHHVRNSPQVRLLVFTSFHHHVFSCHGRIDIVTCWEPLIYFNPDHPRSGYRCCIQNASRIALWLPQDSHCTTAGHGCPQARLRAIQGRSRRS